MISPVLERGREQAGEEIVGGDWRLSVWMVALERERRGRIIGGGIVVGERAAERPLVADGGVADLAGEDGERRNGARARRRSGHLGMGGGGADVTTLAARGE